MKTPRIYKAKTLYTGYKLGLLNDKLYVGIPGGQTYPHEQNFKNVKNFIVQYDNKIMRIRSWHKGEKKIEFEDHQGRGKYTLSYFKWKPIEPVEEVSAIKALGKFAGTPEYEALRIKLHT